MSQLAPTQPQPAAQAPPGQPPGSTSAPPGAADKEPPFEAALDAELARTATAEGQGAEQQDGKATARRGGHDRSADDMLAGAAGALVATTAASDSGSGTATSTSVVASDLDAGTVGTEVGGAQPPSTQLPQDAQAAVGRVGTESIARDEQADGSGPNAAPDPATSAGESAPPIAPSGSASPAETLAPSPSDSTTQPQQQPPLAAEMPAVGFDQSTQGASRTTSTTGERARTNQRPADEPHGNSSAIDAAPATGSAAAQAGPAPSAPSPGDRLSAPAEAEAEAPTPQRLANDAADAAAPQVLDNATAGAAQRAPASTLQTPSEASPLQPIAGPGVGLQQAVESLQATVELAAHQGLTQARIQLHPAELGEIRVHLTQTSAGLLARVSAESSAAAQALISAHGELRQSLSSLGIDLAQLHVGAHEAVGVDLGQPGTGSQQQADAQQQPSAHASGDRRDGRTNAIDGLGEETSSIDHTTDPVDAVESVTGARAALIDVLA